MFTQLFAHHCPSVSFPPSRYSFLCTEVHPLVILALMALRSKPSFCFFPEKVFILPSLLVYYFHLYYLLNDCLTESRMIGWEKISSFYFRYYYFLIGPVLLLTRSPTAVALYTFFSILLPRTGACVECSAVSAMCPGVEMLECTLLGWPFFNLRTHVLFPVLNYSSIVSE